MRGFVFTIDMVYGAIAIVLLFSILIHSNQPSFSPQYQLLQIQAKDAVMNWFYGGAPGANACPAVSSACACDTGFRPRVTSDPLLPNVNNSWVSQQVCVGAP